MNGEPRLTAAQAIEVLGLCSVGALRSFLYRRRQAGFPVPTYRLGRSLRFERADLLAAMTKERNLTAVSRRSA